MCRPPRPDHHHQLGLVVDLRAGAGDHDRIAVGPHRGGKLAEHDRLRRQRLAGLAGVVGVVQADADHLVGKRHRRHQPQTVQRHNLAPGGRLTGPLDAGGPLGQELFHAVGHGRVGPVEVDGSPVSQRGRSWSGGALVADQSHGGLLGVGGQRRDGNHTTGRMRMGSISRVFR